MTLTIQNLHAGDEAHLTPVLPDVFDHAIDPETARAFLANPDTHLIVARAPEGGAICGFVSATRLVHPDKPGGEVFVQEIGVAPAYRRQGVATRLLEALKTAARAQGCKLAWLAVDPDNAAALALYRAAGGGAPEAQIHVDFDL